MEGGQQSPSQPGREQYVMELSQKLEEWDEKVEQITSKSSQDETESVLLDDLLEKQAEAHERLEEVRESDDAMWEELKAQASVASQSYQDVLERAAERFKVDGPRNASHESQRQEGGSGPQADGRQEGSSTSESTSQNETEASDEMRGGGMGNRGTETPDSA